MLFLRYPQPGLTKTRLIPALGAKGAAQFQRQMVEYLLGRFGKLERQLESQPEYQLEIQTAVQPENLPENLPAVQPENLPEVPPENPLNWQLEIHFTGGSLVDMQIWLGPQLAYVPQSTGDLGQRLQAGFQHGFSHAQAGGADAGNGTESKEVRIVAIGSDCPELSSAHIQSALQQLSRHDVVLGPAQDGGYYLIGLRSPCPALFQSINWSTSVVLQQTQAKAQQLGLSVAQLPMLSDIDRPEDLAIWQRIQQEASYVHDS